MNLLDGLKLCIFVDEKEDWHGICLPEEDRASHLYVIGSTGVEKNKALVT